LSSSEDAAIQGVTVGVVSISEGSAILYAGTPHRASGIFNYTVLIA
jgi:hypothetical protein